MTSTLRCKCGFPTPAEWARKVRFTGAAYGEAFARAHRAHHDEWMATQHTPEPSAHDLTDLYIRIDQLIAHAHGGPLPGLTAGAQAVLTRHTLNERER